MTNTERSTGRILLIIGLIVGTVVALGLGVWQMSEKNRPAPTLISDQADARQTVLDTVTTNLAKVLSYTPKTTDDDVATTAELLTGKAQDHYRESMRSTVTIASGNGTTQTTTVLRAAIESLSDDKALVLAFLDQKISSTSNNTQTAANFAARVNLTKINGSWLIEAFTQLV